MATISSRFGMKTSLSHEWNSDHAASFCDSLIASAVRMRRMVASEAKGSAVESSPSRLPEATNPDLLTIVAITIAATVIADFIHEGFGHGGMCVATGGRPLLLSTVHFECSADTRLVAAGGTLANLIFGALLWFAERAVKRPASWRYFFWLLMTLNLFDAGGYFLFSGIGNIGDWAAVVVGNQFGRGAWAWLRWGWLPISSFLYLSPCANCVRS
jgi:hypothetical protein